MVNNRELVAFLITFLLGIIGIIIFPYYTINPGVVIEDHSRLKNDCLSCHSLGEGAQTKKCIECHQLSIIGLKYVNGEKRITINSKYNLLHNSIVKIQCVDCHTEHNGLSRENATLNFKHEILMAELQKECTNCHSPEKPKDEIHILLEVQCSDCHYTSGWMPSHFKHELLGDRKNDCRSCHENKRPGDNLHKQIGRDIQCLQCHNTQAWKPSTFDHSKYFRFDSNHPSNCSNCHNVSASFKTYSCYNCHEHTPARIQKEHFKEGIKNFTKCVECHRSGDEDETITKKNTKQRRDS